MLTTIRNSEGAAWPVDECTLRTDWSFAVGHRVGNGHGTDGRRRRSARQRLRPVRARSTLNGEAYEEITSTTAQTAQA